MASQPGHPLTPRSRLRAWLQLLRVGTLFSPAADVVAGTCLAGLAWGAAPLRTMAASVCVYAAGMVWNDWADRGVDARVRPERPLPSGRIRPAAAVVVGAILLAAALALAVGRVYYLVLAAGVLAYDLLLKRDALVGALAMGSLRALNLAAAPATLAPGPVTRPVLIAAACYGGYIVAVTLLGILEDHRNVRRRAVVSIQMVPPALAAAAMLGMPEPWPAAALAFALAAAFVLHVRRTAEWDRAAIRRSMTWLLLGTMLYTGLLCGSAGRWPEALAVLAAVQPARWIARRIALT